MLYRPEGFEQLTEEPWDEAHVRDAIAAIVADADAAFADDGLWPAEEWDAWTSPLPLKSLYVGAAGVVWALDALRRRGYAETSVDLAATARRALEAWRAEPELTNAQIELPEPAEAGLLSAESGILLAARRVDPGRELEDALYERVCSNVGNPANELMWGAPGTMIAARTMLDWTGDERWAAAWRDSADELLRRREPDGAWTQRLYGRTSRYLGPAHGLVGNVLALLEGRELLDDGRRDQIVLDTRELLSGTSVVEDGCANWPPEVGGPLVPRDGEIRLQWCHGAPGIVASAADYLDEELLLAGAELTWRAGPHGDEKGPGICHGTAGNGHALLKTFERTGDELWLERARRLAAHALVQVERTRTARGRGRYSLWTGDPGVALYAADCIDGRSAYPVVDTR